MKRVALTVGLSMMFLFSSLLLWHVAGHYSAAASSSTQCQISRYVFDIGSGSTKISGALLDVCQGKVLKIYPKHSILMEYQKCLDASSQQTISEQCMRDGLIVIDQLKAKYGATCSNSHDQCYGLATAWARNAKNVESFFKQIEGTHGMKAFIVSQKDEGVIGFYAALSKIRAAAPKDSIAEDNVVVLDIGGGSFQLTGVDNDKVHVALGMYGMYNFTNEIHKKLGLNLGQRIGKEQIATTIEMVDDEIAGIMRDNQWTLAKSSQGGSLIGIGTLLSLGVRSQLYLGNTVKKEQLLKLAYEMAEMDDATLSRNFKEMPAKVIPYIQQAVILIYCIMKDTGFDEMHIVDVGLAEYLATSVNLGPEHMARGIFNITEAEHAK